MANKDTAALTAISALNFADIFALVQGGNSRKADFTQVQSLLDEQISRTLIKPAGNQGRLSLVSSMVTVTPNGASVTATGLIPARAICLGVTSYVITTLTGGVTNFDIGYTGALTAFGAALPITAGSAFIGSVAPFVPAAALNVIVTNNGGTGSTNGNKLRLVAYYLAFTLPTA